MENSFSLSNLKIYHILLWMFLVIITSIFIVGMPPSFTFATAGGILSLVVFPFKPKIGILAIVILISSIVFEDALPLIPLGIGSFHIPDIFLLFLLCMIPVKLITDKNFRFVKTTLDKPLILFYCLALLSAGIATIYFNVDFNIVMRKLRYLTYYLVFFVVTNLIQEKSEIKFIIKGFLVIAAMVGVAMIIQAVIGESFQIMPGRVEMASTLGKTYQTLRILPPGQTLIYVMFVTIVCQLVIINKPFFEKSYLYMFLIIIGIAVLLTYNRSYWVAITFSLNILLLIMSVKVKMRILALFFITVILMSIFSPLFLTSSSKMQETLTSLSNRFTSLLKVERVYGSSSFNWRKIENKLAIEKIKKYPIFGIGLGNDYRSAISCDDNLTRYIHNGYLYIALKMGLLGLFAYLWFYTKFLIRGFVHWKSIKDDFLRSSILGFTLSGLGILLANIVNPMFMQWFSIVVIAVMIGLTEAIIRINEKDLKRSSG